MNDIGTTSISYERKGYGRGLILGLTMAETMLLLVFCLLLVAGSIIAKKQAELDLAVKSTESQRMAAIALANENIRLADENKGLLSQISEFMDSKAGHKVPDEEWRKLVMAKSAVAQIERSGLSVEEAIRLTDVTIAARDNRLNAEDLPRLVRTEQRAIEAEKKLAASGGKPHEWPPIIDLSEAKGYSFEVASAELKPDFEAKLTGSIAEQIANIVRKYGVDVVEVIGHTDEQRLSKQSNMDHVLPRVLSGQEKVSVMAPGDNAGLGLARAVSVTRVLKQVRALHHLDILPLSGAQLILPDDRMTEGADAGDAPARRRIEIRVRKSKRQLAAEAVSNTNP